MDRLAWALVVLVFLLLDKRVKPFWPAAGLLVLYVLVCSSFVDVSSVKFYIREGLKNGMNRVFDQSAVTLCG